MAHVSDKDMQPEVRLGSDATVAWMEGPVQPHRLWYTASCVNETGREIYEILNEAADEREADQYDVIKEVWEGNDNTSIANLFNVAYYGCSVCCRRLIG